MKNKVMMSLAIVASIAVGALATYFSFRGEGLERAGDSPVRERGISVVKTRVTPTGKTVTRVSLLSEKGQKVVRIEETDHIRSGVRPQEGETGRQPDDVDEEDLTEAQKGVLRELQDALDDNNLNRVRRALRKFVAKVGEGGFEGRVPACMRARAVEALGWFGKDAAVDLMPFMSDANEDVANDAVVQFDQALSDSDMGDKERSQVLSGAMKVLNDADQVDSLLSQLNDMRNSVKVETAVLILTSGSETAKTKLLEDMSLYFDDDVKDVDGLAKWKAMNPDDPGDAEMFGGQK